MVCVVADCIGTGPMGSVVTFSPVSEFMTSRVRLVQAAKMRRCCLSMARARGSAHSGPTE